MFYKKISNKMIIPKKEDCDKIAIIVVGYNRLDSLARLLDSLVHAYYPEHSVPLLISIDCSGNEQLYKFVSTFNWPFGNKYVIIHSQRLGLKNHIFHCGDYSKYFRAIILLEDDLYVSTDFYNYVLQAVTRYENEDAIAQIALYRNELNGYVGLPFHPLNNGYDVFAWQAATSWGECWTYSMWKKFVEWRDKWDGNFEPIDIHYRSKAYTRAWGKYFDAYMVENNKYAIYPYYSLCTNFGDAGEHSSTSNSDYQVNLQHGTRTYRFGELSDLLKYDCYVNYIGLLDYLDVEKDNVCLDLYGDNPNIKKKRYILSTKKYPYKVIKSYGLCMRPIELNIINDIAGTGIYLYDTKIDSHSTRRVMPNRALRYFLQGFRPLYLYSYLIRYSLSRIKAKFCK